MSATIDTWAGGVGLAAGFCAVLAWLAFAGRPADAPAPSASVRLGAAARGELGVAPLGKPVLKSSTLRPGDGGAAGDLTIRNETPRRLAVSVRTTAVQKELDSTAWVAVESGNRTLLRRPLARAHGWSRKTVTMPSLATRRLRAQVWIPSGTRDGWQAAREDLTLEFRAQAVNGR